MKRNPKRTLLAWLLTAAMLASLLPSAALAASGEAAEEETAAEQAEEFTSETVSDEGYRLADDSETATSGTCGDNLTWTLEDGVLTISGTGDMADYYNDAPWYNSRESITSVVIGDGVTSIGSCAFSDCTGLTSVTIGSSMTSIGSDAFSYCTGLTSIIIPDSVTSIDRDAFSYCTGLTSATIPDSVTSIGNYAFSVCTGLTSVTIPDSVTSIGYYAFGDCTGLTSIAIGSGVTSIDSGAFYNTGFYNDESNWEDGVLYLGNYLLKADADSLEGSYTIKEGTTVIADYAFRNCIGLTSVTIPDSVTSIGYSAFCDCTGLTSVTIPDSVTSIGSSAFRGCTGLTSVTIPASVTSIGNYAFGDCTGLTSIAIGSGVTSIGDYAFYNTGFYNDESNWEDSVLYLGNYLLKADADALEGSYTIKESTTVIADYAFYRCTGLTDVYYSGSETDWAAISIGIANDCLTSATLHCAQEDTNTHSYTGAVTKEATCGADGVMTYTCSGCGDSYTEIIPATGNHTAGETAQENVVEATATENGSYDNVVYCTVCGAEISRETVTVPATGSDDHTHSRTSAVTTAATCGEDGVMTYTCAECGASYTETIPATGEHTWDSGTVTLKATRYTEGEKTYTCTVCGGTKTEAIAVLTGSDAEFLFGDVSSSNDWYYEAVYWAYDLGITKGTSDTAFSPNGDCTRVQFATFLYRLAQASGEDVSCGLDSSPFDDVIEGVTYSEYYVAILWAYENEITNGTSATTFSPDDPINRAQAVTMLYRYEKMVNGEPSVNGSSPFSDVIEGVTYSDYYTAILWACDLGITNGNSDGGNRFDINVTCSRAMMVTFLHRYAVEPLTTA